MNEALKALDYAARSLRAVVTGADGQERDEDEHRIALLVGAEHVRRLAESARQAIAEAL